MKNPHDIIIQPIITERSTTEAAFGKYTFKVDARASKTEIRQACETLFEVRVVAVNTMNVSGKKKRQGVKTGRTAAWKKAVVTIDQSPSADSYQGKGGKSVDTGRKYKNSIEAFGYGH